MKLNDVKNILFIIKPLSTEKQKKISSYGHPFYDPLVYIPNDDKPHLSKKKKD